MSDEAAEDVAESSPHVQDNLLTRYHFHCDEMIVQRTQDCTAIAEDATARRNEGFHGSEDMRLAARIPEVMVEKYCNDHGVDFSEFMSNKEHIRRMLNDPALAYFRVWPGKI